MTTRRASSSLLLCATLLAACSPAPVTMDATANDSSADAAQSEASLDAPPADVAPACSAMQTLCSGSCADTNSDPRNCGACGAACPSGQVCVSGACGLQCGPNQRVCNGGCVDLQTDRANCGACGAACPQGQVCALGACGVECGAGLALCGSAGDAGAADGGASGRYCADTRTDNRNCGACGNACGAGRSCVDGMCAASCMTGLTDCAGACRDTANDPRNCGACGMSCAAGPNQTPVCASSRCAVVCSAGFLDCNMVAADGCETSALTDVNNCGACGRSCTAANGTAACRAGACAVGACNAGFNDCNMVAADGCETSLLTDRANCGACGRACATTESCVAGACVSVAWSNSTAPALIPASAGCTLLLDTNADQLDLSPAGYAFLLLRCGANTRLTVSVDGARTWSTPLALPVGTDLDAMQVYARTDSEVFVLAGLSVTGEVRVLRSTDRGATFGAPVTVGTRLGNNGPGPSVSLIASGANLYATWSGFTFNIPVVVSSDNGATWTALPSALNPSVTSDLAFNTMGSLVLGTEFNRAVFVLPTGATAWSTVGSLGSQSGFTDFAGGGSLLFATGSTASVQRASIDAFTATSVVSAAVASADMARSMDADSAGNLAFSSRLSTTVTRIQSWPATATTFDTGVDVTLASTTNSATAAIPTRRGSLTAIAAAGGVYTFVRVF